MAESKNETCKQLLFLRYQCDLSWDEIARLVSVGKRLVHSWSGQANINFYHVERINYITRTILACQKSTPAETRSAIMSNQSDGVCVFQAILRKYADNSPIREGFSVDQLLSYDKFLELEKEHE